MTKHVNAEPARGVWKRPAVFVGVAAAALVLGYIDLWRGGLTLSAVLLSVGYCVLVPVAIMATPAVARARKRNS